MRKHIITILTGLMAFTAAAQQPLSLYYVDNVPQTSALNPARQPRANGYFAIPGANVSFMLESNIMLKEFFQEKNGVWVTPTSREFDYSKFHKRFKNGARLRPNVDVSLLNFGWRGSKGYWTIGVNERVQSNIALPSAIFNMLDNGLAPGTTLNFANMRVNAKVFHEISVGYSRDVTEQLAMGWRVKYLSGIGAVKTDFKKFDLTTGRDKWTLEAEGGIYTSIPNLKMQEKENGMVDFDSTSFDELKTKDIVNVLIPFMHNPGAAIDFGFNYTIDENFSFSASITDLGFIAWTNELNSINVNGGYQFEGLEINVTDAKNIDYSEAFDNIMDSIQTRMSPTLSKDVFATLLNPNIYVGAAYSPTHFLTIGLLSKSTILNKTVTQDFDLSLNLNPYKCFSLMTGLDYNVKGHLAANFGWSLNFSILQLYMMTDYVPVAYRKVNIEGDGTVLPNNTGDVNVSVGLNLIFGAKGYRDKPMINAYSDF